MFERNKTQKSTQQHKKSHLLAKVVGVGVATTAVTGVVGVASVWGGWQYAKQQYKNRRMHTPAFNGLIGNQRFTGQVQKVGQSMTLITDGMVYAVEDPLAKLESVYHKDKTPQSDNTNNTTKLMDSVHCDDICIIAELSQKGHYGYLGHLDYQLTVIDICDHQVDY